MGTFIIVFIVGNIILVCNNAENDSFEAFNALMAFFLIMYLIASFFNWITADKEETKDEQEKGLMWYAWWIIIFIFGAGTLRISVVPFIAFTVIMFSWLIVHISSLISKKIAKHKAYEVSKKPIENNQLDKLEKLALLKSQGTLTNEEFAEQKAKILNKIK